MAEVSKIVADKDDEIRMLREMVRGSRSSKGFSDTTYLSLSDRKSGSGKVGVFDVV
jgi:hypothetical protein